MDRDRPGGETNAPGDLPSDFDEWRAAQRGETATPPHQPAANQSTIPSAQRQRFTVQPGNKSVAGPPEEFAGAPGAETRGSHGLEVVHVTEPREEPRENPSDQPLEDEIAARMMRGIEEAVAELRRQAAGRVISLHRPGEPRPQEGPNCVDPFRSLYGALLHFVQRARRLAAAKPKQTAAAIVALGLAFGAALRLRKSHD